MNYIIKINYKDGQELNISLPKEEVVKFLDKQSKNEPYWAPNEETAFWTNNKEVRYANAVLSKPSEAPSEPAKEPDIKPTETKEEVKSEV